MDVTGRDRPDDRGQALTLEAVVAAIFILGSVAFALQLVAVTANTGSTADEGIESQHRGVAEGLLDAAVEDGSLHATLRYWNETDGAFHGADPNGGYYVATSPPTEFGALLDRSFEDRHVRYNVNVRYATANDVETKRLVVHGTPTDDAVRVTTDLTLYGDEQLLAADETPTNTTLAEADFFAPDAVPGSDVYTVVRVEVIVWTA